MRRRTAAPRRARFRPHRLRSPPRCPNARPRGPRAAGHPAAARVATRRQPRRRGRRGRDQPRRTARGDPRLRRLPPARYRDQPGLRRWRAGQRPDADRRGAGRRGGPARQALRRRLGAVARPHVRLDRAEARRGRLLHHQHPALAPAGQPHADRCRDRAVRSLRAAPHRPGAAAPCGAAGRHAGQGAAADARRASPACAANGSRWRSRASGEVPTLATLHPAYLLRTPAAKRDAWADLLLLRRSITI